MVYFPSDMEMCHNQKPFTLNLVLLLFVGITRLGP